MTSVVIFHRNMMKMSDRGGFMRSDAVHLFVFDTMADWEAAFAVAGIQNPQFQLAPGRLSRGDGGGQPRADHDGRRRAHPARHDARDITPSQSGMLILPGGELWERGGNSEAIAKTREFIAALCAGGGHLRGDSGAGACRPARQPLSHQQRARISGGERLSRRPVLSRCSGDQRSGRDHRIRRCSR